MKDVEDTNVFVCLNVAAIMKDQYTKQMEEQRKMESRINKR